MTKFTEKGAKYNEQLVLDLFSFIPGCKLKAAKDKYSHYDLYGTIDDCPTMIEVKERDRWFPEMWIEEQKLLDIFSEANKWSKKTPKEVKCLLVLSVRGEHLLYDMKHLWTYSKRTKAEMNAHTASGFANEGIKKIKKVIEFRKDSYMVNLRTFDIGKNYEKVLF